MARKEGLPKKTVSKENSGIWAAPHPSGTLGIWAGMPPPKRSADPVPVPVVEVSPPDRVRGLQGADEATRERVARAGGSAPHRLRGLQGADAATRKRVARAGGSAPHRLRGLQGADAATRERVARAGGSAPHRVRGLQAADEVTRARVSSLGGSASRHETESGDAVA